MATLTRPVVGLLSVSTNAVVRMLGLDPRAGGEEVTEEELRDMVSTHGELGTEERRVLSDVFGAADRQLGSVMIPRTEVSFLDADTPLAAAAHPSPLSAHNGFFGSRPFSRTNAALVAAGLDPIDWRL